MIVPVSAYKDNKLQALFLSLIFFLFLVLISFWTLVFGEENIILMSQGLNERHLV